MCSRMHVTVLGYYILAYKLYGVSRCINPYAKEKHQDFQNGQTRALIVTQELSTEVWKLLD